MEIKNQPAFTSRIIVLNGNQHWDYLLSKKNRTLCKVDDIVLDKFAYTDGAATCLAGSIMNRANKSLCSVLHMCMPNEIDVNKILANVNKLNMPENPANIFITGGESPWFLSERYFKFVMQSLDNLKQRISVIWGQKDAGYTNFICDAEHDIIAINHSGNDGKEIKNLADLRDVYEKVEIADGDELFFGEQHLPQYFL